jgi:hypothetical protein
VTEQPTPKNYTYSVPPWGDRYRQTPGQRRGNFNGYPCAICGRDIPSDADVRWGGIITSDGEWTTDPNHPRSQGWHPVGSNCHRRFVVRSEEER